MDKMKAMVFRGVDKIVLEDVPRPKILKSDDAIVRITSTTICGSDLHFLKGEVPLDVGQIVGHEFLGVVDEVGDFVNNFQPGERVLVVPFFGGGGFGVQSNIGGIDGGQAEYVRVPQADKTLLRFPQEMTDEQVMFVTDILSTGYFGAENGAIIPGDTVAVFGCGPVGICAQVTAQLFGPSKVFGVDLNSDRLKMAERFGSIPIDASKDDAPTKIRELTEGLGVNVAIEAVGLPATFKGCLKSTQFTSNISVIGIFSEPVTLPMHAISWNSRRITMGMPLKMNDYIPKLLALIKCGKIDMTPLITHTLPLSEGEKAYEMFDKQIDGAMKIILKPGE